MTPQKAAATLASALAFFLPSGADACGGLFCSASAPVNQTAERILFAQEDGVTTQIVEILYEGPSERFAWVLPVPGAPEVAVSSKQVFDRLQGATNPSYRLTPTFPEDCAFPEAASGVTGGTGATGGTGGSGPMVSVVDAGSVGPFDYETISVDPADQDPSDVAIRWLSENEYDVGALGPDVLRPYLENGLNLIAVKLQKGFDAGSIQPLSLTFEGMQPAIPIRPTAVAATEDMGILVWILGASRAVPMNYYGLELNEALIDWTNPGPTYDRVVSAAADEAGGQGFVTEFAGETAPFAELLRSGVEPLSQPQLSAVEEELTWLANNYGTFDGFVRVLSQHVAFRDELSAEDFATCPNCYFEPQSYGPVMGTDFGESYDPETDPILETDLSALFAAIDEDVLRPIRDAADLILSHGYMTRLYTTMSADEMDEDPVFDFNPELEDVSNLHVAEQEFSDCGGADWVVTLPNGTTVESVDGQWPLSPEDPQGLPFNTRILSFSTSGPGVVATDNEEMVEEMMEDMENVKPAAGGGSGTGSTASTGGSSAGAGGSEAGDASDRDGTGGSLETDPEGGLCSLQAPGRPGDLPSPWGWFPLGALGVLGFRRRRQSRGRPEDVPVLPGT